MQVTKQIKQTNKNNNQPWEERKSESRFATIVSKFVAKNVRHGKKQERMIHAQKKHSPQIDTVSKVFLDVELRRFHSSYYKHFQRTKVNHEDKGTSNSEYQQTQKL